MPVVHHGRRAAAAVAAVALVQIVVGVVTAVIWYVSTVFAGTACAPDCDWAAAELARTAYIGVLVVSFAVTAVAVVVAWRTARQLSWVPLATSALTIVGFAAFLTMFQTAMS